MSGTTAHTEVTIREDGLQAACRQGPLCFVSVLNVFMRDDEAENHVSHGVPDLRHPLTS
jgi:hypothetical protein